jgi:hypothetical protein
MARVVKLFKDIVHADRIEEVRLDKRTDSPKLACQQLGSL